MIIDNALSGHPPVQPAQTPSRIAPRGTGIISPRPVIDAPGQSAGGGRLFSDDAGHILNDEEKRFFERLFSSAAAGEFTPVGYRAEGRPVRERIGTMFDRKG